MPSLELFLLGPPRIQRDGRPAHVGLHKSIALLAYLAVTHETHTRDSLASLLWPESDQTSARMSLRQALSHLKKVLGEEWLDTKRESLGLNGSYCFWLDVDRFQQLMAEYQTHGHSAEKVCPACLGPLTEAALIYRGDFMAGFTLRDSFAFDEWQILQAETLRSQLGDALGRLAHEYGAQHLFEQAIAYAGRWLLLDPLHEEAHRCLMALYAQAGQRAAALRQYDACVQALEQEMGVSPAKDTVRLYEDIRESRTLQFPGFTSTTSLACPHNLPLHPTSFVGRDDELATIERLLSDPLRRLVTVTGPGGVGKTCLALQAATRVVQGRCEVFPHGVYFVPLASLNSAERLVPAMASALEFSFYPGPEPREQLLNYLRGKRLLLVLDNFEHLLEGTELLVEMLSRTPGLRLLVTSRERLNLQWESPFLLHGLGFPQADEVDAIETYPAVQLFLQSASRVDAEFQLQGTAQSDVVRLCRYLEGIPLAIQLAASNVETMSCREIAEQIKGNLDLLASALRDVPERHRSLRAVFDHSWKLLSAGEQDLFARLSVFRGSFDKEAAEAVAGTSLLDLSALARKSLLQKVTSGRYEMLQMVRQYASEKLRATPAWTTTHDRHCEFYAGFLDCREPDLKGKRQREALEEITREIENVSSAWQWAVANRRNEAIASAAESLYLYYEMQSLFEEGERVFGAAAAELRKAVVEEGQSTGRRLERSGSRIILGGILARWAWFQYRLAHLEEARLIAQESLSILRPLGAHGDTILALSALRSIVAHLGDREMARRLCQESLAMCSELDDQWNMAGCLNVLGAIAWMEQDFVQARENCQAALAIWTDLGDQRRRASALNNLGMVALFLEEHAEAEQLWGQAIAIYREVGDRWGILNCSGNLAANAELLGRYDEAKRNIWQALRFAQEIGNQHVMSSSWNDLGFIHCAVQEYEAASRYFRTALRIATDIHTPSTALEALVGLGIILGQSDEQKRRAVELAAFGLNHPQANPDVKKRAQHLLSEMEPQLPAQDFVEAQEEGKRRDLEYYAGIYREDWSMEEMFSFGSKRRISDPAS